MSATLGTVLKELEPSLNIAMFETLADCAQESSQAWNNAGTGHAANCELNYTPQRGDGSVRHLQGAGSEHRVRPLAPALVVSRLEGRDPRAREPSFIRARTSVSSGTTRMSPSCGNAIARCRRTIATTAWSTVRITGRSPIGRRSHRGARSEAGDRGDANHLRRRRRLWRADPSPRRAAFSAVRLSPSITGIGLRIWRNRKTAGGGCPSKTSLRGRSGRFQQSSSSLAPAAARLSFCRSPAYPRGMAMAGSQSAGSGCVVTWTPSARDIMPRSMARQHKARRQCRFPISIRA